MPLPSAALPEAAALVVLFVLSAFFAMSETAMIGVNRHHVRQRAQAGGRRAKRLDQMLDDPERILSTVLVGSTIVNITAAALGTHVASKLFPNSYPDIIGSVAVTLIVLVLCELVPKTLAVQSPMTFALNLAQPLRVVEAILRPIIALSSAVAKTIVRPFGLKAKGKAPFITSDEIEMLVRFGVESGEVERFEQRVIAELFEFTETPASKVMTPATNAHFLPRTATLAEATQMANRERRSRILVADGDFDHVLGFVHIKDLLRHSDADLARLPVTSALRPVLITQAATRADVLLGRMQREHRSLAVVQDRTGVNVGIVTADDLLEELVGEIHDEFDAARQGHRDAPKPA